MPWTRLRYFTILGLVAVGFWTRLLYLTASHPFFDEFTTILAAKQVLQRGLPVLPSNLFYEHGLLFTYLDALTLALFQLFGNLQAGVNLEASARWASLLGSVLTIPVLYAVGRRWFNPWVGLLAAGLLAFSPEGMIWGGRARMYALATLLALLTGLLAYEGAVGAGRARWRWLALLALLATLLTHFGAMVLVGPLLVAALVVGRITRPAAEVESRPQPSWLSRSHWPGLLAQAFGLAGVVFISILVKRWGQPLGAAPLGSDDAGNVFLEALSAVTYQTRLSLEPAAALNFLARQFGVPHHLWLTVVAVLGAGVWIGGKLAPWGNIILRNRPNARPVNQSTNLPIYQSAAYLFTLLIFALIILEMITLLPPWRRNPRYIVMFLPLFYLLVGAGVVNLLPKPLIGGVSMAFPVRSNDFSRRGWSARLKSSLRTQAVVPLATLLALVVFGLLGFPDWRIAYRTPEPAYEVAFLYVQDQWQPGDAILTMNVSAVALYLPDAVTAKAAYFPIQEDADQFLLPTQSGATVREGYELSESRSDSEATVPKGHTLYGTDQRHGRTGQTGAYGGQVDRWLGALWVGDVLAFNRVLNAHPRTWFVTDTIRLPVYYRGDWLALLNSQMEPVLETDDVILYQTKPDRLPVPTEPDTPLAADFGGLVRLTGFSLQSSPAASTASVRITLFWTALADIPLDYTVFLHLRDASGTTVAQHDGQPLQGLYPTGQWEPGEMLADAIALDVSRVPAGTYTLYAGLYDLATLQRLPVANDTSGENAVTLGEVRLP